MRAWLRTVLFLVRKEYLQIFRDRPTVFQIFFIPLVQLLLLTYAATFEISRARAHVVDLDRTSVSRGLVDRLTASGRFTVVARSASMRLANEDLLGRRASLVVHIPRGFERDLVRRGVAPVQLVLDAESGATAGVVQSYATRIIADYAAELGAELRPELRSVRRGAGEAPPAPGRPTIAVHARGWYNPTLDYKHYMVPGLLVSLVTVIGTLLTSQNIAREKELGTLEQLNVTPLTKGQFIAGKLLPFWILAMVTFSLCLVLGKFAFGVPTRGSLLLVFFSAAVYLVATLGIGLWVSTVARTQQQTIFMAFFILVIYILMSGLFTPIDSMPAWARWVAELNPVKHFVAIMRSVLMKGAGLADVRVPLAVLAVYGAAVLGLAVRQYSKTTA